MGNIICELEQSTCYPPVEDRTKTVDQQKIQKKIVVKHYLSPKKGGWGANDTTKPPSFTDFFAQII